jgi:hypothetical protein
MLTGTQSPLLDEPAVAPCAPMINASHLDSSDQVLDPYFLTGLFDLSCHELQLTGSVLNAGGFDEHFAIEVAQHPFRSAFRTVDSDDAEVGGTNLLDSLLNEPRKPDISPLFFRVCGNSWRG